MGRTKERIKKGERKEAKAGASRDAVRRDMSSSQRQRRRLEVAMQQYANGLREPYILIGVGNGCYGFCAEGLGMPSYPVLSRFSQPDEVVGAVIDTLGQCLGRRADNLDYGSCSVNYLVLPPNGNGERTAKGAIGSPKDLVAFTKKVDAFYRN